MLDACCLLLDAGVFPWRGEANLVWSELGREREGERERGREGEGVGCDESRTRSSAI